MEDSDIKIVDDNGAIQTCTYSNFTVLSFGDDFERGSKEKEKRNRPLRNSYRKCDSIFRHYILSPEDINLIEEYCQRTGVNEITIHQAIRILQNISQDYFVEAVTNHRYSISVSKGVLAMLANGVISDDIFKLTENNVATISLLFGISEDNDPGRTLRRYRKKASNFFTKFCNWIPSTKLTSGMSFNSILYSEVAFHVDKAWADLMCLKDRFVDVAITNHRKKLIEVLVTCPQKVIKQICNRICGHFFSQYCPQ